MYFKGIKSIASYGSDMEWLLTRNTLWIAAFADDHFLTFLSVSSKILQGLITSQGIPDIVITVICNVLAMNTIFY